MILAKTVRPRSPIIRDSGMAASRTIHDIAPTPAMATSTAIF